MAEIWCPFAVRRDGPLSKQGYTGAESPPGSPKTGMVWHSAEGWRPGVHSVIDDVARRASFQFGIFKVEPLLEQYYPVLSNCWHAGDVYRDENVDVEGELAANIDLVGAEFEGLTGQPLTEAQYDTGIKLYKWLAEACHFSPPSRQGTYPKKTLWEHHEVSDAPTSCPSGRIDWRRVMEGLMPPTTLTREQLINMLKSEKKAVEDARKEYWRKAFQFAGLEVPPELQ